MAIIIEAKSIKIEIKQNHSSYVSGKIDKVADIVNIEAYEGNLILSSKKQIITLGNKKRNQ